MKKLLYILITLTLMLTFASCTQQPITVSDTTFALDTLVQIKIYYESSRDANEEIIPGAFSLVNELEDILSVHIEDSELYNLKENAGQNSVKVSQITYDIIKDSVSYSQITDGLFDVTSGPLIDLWNIDPPNGYVPTEDELDSVLQLVDYTRINFLSDDEIFLEDEGMIINLGAIAKGAIADSVKAYLVDNGVTSAYINLGGNILLIGSKPDGSSFSTGIQNPFDGRGAYLMAVAANDIAVVSSGDYERYFEQDGLIYHHILNTKTGYPADTNIKQISIIAPNSQMADALSTSVLLLGIEDGLALINSIDNVEAIFITKDKKIYITGDLENQVTFHESEMADFTVVEDASELY